MTTVKDREKNVMRSYTGFLESSKQSIYTDTMAEPRLDFLFSTLPMPQRKKKIFLVYPWIGKLINS